MPVSIKKDPSGKGYQVSTPGGIKGSKMTLKNAHAQARLLNAVEHGWTPTGKKKNNDKDED